MLSNIVVHMTEPQFDFKNVSTTTLRDDVKEIVAKTTRVLQQIVDARDRCFANTIQPLIDINSQLRARKRLSHIVKNFYPDKNLREVASSVEDELSAFDIECSMRRDVYEAMRDYYNGQYLVEKSLLTAEQQRYMDNSMRDYKRLGMHLRGDGFEELKSMQKELATVGSKFRFNLNEDKTSFEMTKEELAGVPESWFTADKLLSNGKYKVTLKYPDYFPIMQNAISDDVRHRVYMAFCNRCVVENTPLLQRALFLRREIAHLLGYATYADYVTEVKIVKCANKALDFEMRLNNRIDAKYTEYIANLLKFAKTHSWFNKERLDEWDYSYFNRTYKESVCDFNTEELKQYFPLDVVKRGMFDIYQRLLGLEFTLIDTENKWHDEVELYKVTDVVAGDTIGWFYLDMHPRDGKYGHAAVFEFVDPTRDQPGVVMMACNFPRNGCIGFDDVVTFFHEFGHVMHQLCSKPQLQEFSGFNTERDFVEAPSQFLEFFCYEPEPLRMMSKHVKTGEPIPPEYFGKLKLSKQVTAPYDKKRQLSFGIFDLKLHMMNISDPAAYWLDVQNSVMHFSTPGNNFPTTFGHFFGYEAGYYGYLLTEVYAAAMFYKKFDRADILNPRAGMEYRKKILEPGATRDGMDLLHDFLGEEPSEEYFSIANGL